LLTLLMLLLLLVLWAVNVSACHPGNNVRARVLSTSSYVVVQSIGPSHPISSTVSSTRQLSAEIARLGIDVPDSERQIVTASKFPSRRRFIVVPKNQKLTNIFQSSSVMSNHANLSITL